MTEEEKAEMIKKTRKGGMYDFLCQNGWKIDKDTLISIAKELAFVVKRSDLDELADNLEDNVIA